MTTTGSPTQIDVRAVAPRERHVLVFSSFRGLGASDAMELVNDYDPKPLYYQMQMEQPGRFSWDYIERGPEVWRVRITKLTQGHAGAQCCGSCGGA